MVELLMVVGMIGVISAIAVPMSGNLMKDLRLNGDARTLWNTIGLAKMRASATFNKTRVFVDVGGGTYSLQTWDKTQVKWVTEQGSTPLSNTVTFSFGSLGSAPPNTQATIAQSPQCLNDVGVAIGGSACVVFNSRGVPIDATGAPTGNDAFYLTDGVSVNGVTVSTTGLVRMWRSRASSASWTKQ